MVKFSSIKTQETRFDNINVYSDQRTSSYAMVLSLGSNQRLFRTMVNTNKKHLDASVKVRPHTLLVPSEEICKRVLCN